MIVVTGASSHVGKELITKLRSANLAFMAVVRSEDRARTLGLDPRETIVWNNENPDILSKHIKNATKLFLLTPWNDEKLLLQNKILDAAASSRITHVVKVGTIVTESDKRILHAGWHREVEHRLERSSFTWTFLRPTLFMSIIFEKWSQGTTHSCLSLPLKNGRVPMIAPKDIAEVAFKSLTDAKHFGQTYSLTGPEALSMNQIAIMLKRRYQSNFNYLDCSNEEFIDRAHRLGLAQWFIHDLTHLLDHFAQNRGSHVVKSDHLTPQTSFRDFLNAQQFGFYSDTVQAPFIKSYAS